MEGEWELTGAAFAVPHCCCSCTAHSLTDSLTRSAADFLTSASPLAPCASLLLQLHKNELHEIDANLSLLRESDKRLERLENKKELVAAEKRAVEAQVANMVQAKNLAPGIMFSVPDVAALNREYLYRKEAQVSDATARLNARAGKKADRYCK